MVAQADLEGVGNAGFADDGGAARKPTAQEAILDAAM